MNTIPNIIRINVDRNVSIRDYDEATEAAQLVVTSIFQTIQGEGPLAGRNAVFLRLAGCNIGAKVDCPWCDTKFTLSEGKRMGIGDVLTEIELMAWTGRRAGDGIGVVVVTGGEPFLQWRVLKELLKYPRAQQYLWQFETNGYLLDSETFEDIEKPGMANVMIVVSPKVPNNLGHYRKPSYEWPSHAVVLKYVVSADPASHYHRPGPLVSASNRIPFRTYISGMTVYKRPLEPGEIASVWDDTLIDRAATAANYAHAARCVMECGDDVKLSYQTHLFGALE